MATCATTFRIGNPPISFGVFMRKMFEGIQPRSREALKSRALRDTVFRLDSDTSLLSSTLSSTIVHR